jgi:hypothetical protein
MKAKNNGVPNQEPMNQFVKEFKGKLQTEASKEISLLKNKCQIYLRAMFNFTGIRLKHQYITVSS